ncbi:SixA phosphatase family protein [Daeguia caeni]|uniref:SixA phosphatase family protein n=1 Tax=Daeguia caeni TaxID=439612 RepID=A0ABV9H752_9HYPH
MSFLLLLRHAKAAWARPGMRDFDRPLDSEGIQSLDRLAESMKAAELFPDRVVLSTSKRTQETAYGLIERLGINVETVLDGTIYSGGPFEYLAAIRKYGDVEHLMLVGHNPTMEDLALALCGAGHPDSLHNLHAGFPPAGLATIRFDKSLTEIDEGAGFLETFPLPDKIS